MDKKEYQSKAIEESYDREGELKHKKEAKYDEEGGKKHKEDDAEKCSKCGKKL